MKNETCVFVVKCKKTKCFRERLFLFLSVCSKKDGKRERERERMKQKEIERNKEREKEIEIE